MHVAWCSIAASLPACLLGTKYLQNNDGLLLFVSVMYTHRKHSHDAREDDHILFTHIKEKETGGKSVNCRTISPNTYHRAHIVVTEAFRETTATTAHKDIPEFHLRETCACLIHGCLKSLQDAQSLMDEST